MALDSKQRVINSEFERNMPWYTLNEAFALMKTNTTVPTLDPLVNKNTTIHCDYSSSLLIAHPLQNYLD